MAAILVRFVAFRTNFILLILNSQMFNFFWIHVCPNFTPNTVITLCYFHHCIIISPMTGCGQGVSIQPSTWPAHSKCLSRYSFMPNILSKVDLVENIFLQVRLQLMSFIMKTCFGHVYMATDSISSPQPSTSVYRAHYLMMQTWPTLNYCSFPWLHNISMVVILQTYSWCSQFFTD